MGVYNNYYIVYYNNNYSQLNDNNNYNDYCAYIEHQNYTAHSSS